MSGLVRKTLNTAYIIPSCIWERQMPWAPPVFLHVLQQIRFRHMIRHAWKHVPFYRDAMRKRGLSPADFRRPEDLRFLPLISNEEFRKDPSIFNSDKIDTGGDMLMRAGNYKKIYWSRQAALQWFARISRSRAVVNNLLGKKSGYVEAYVQPMEDCNHTMNKFWGENLLFRSRASGVHRLNINDPYIDTLRRLNDIRPDIVYCYGSHSEQFFRYIHKNQLDLHAPKIWIYGSDMMSPGMRGFIEEQYGCLVYSTYNMNEMGAFSFECEQSERISPEYRRLLFTLNQRTGRNCARWSYRGSCHFQPGQQGDRYPQLPYRRQGQDEQGTVFMWKEISLSSRNCREESVTLSTAWMELTFPMLYWQHHPEKCWQR